jgi:hypothetical protein
MKFIHFIRYELPDELKVATASGAAGGFCTAIYNFVTDETILKFISALGIWGTVVTMLLTWVYWLVRIVKEKGKEKTQ